MEGREEWASAEIVGPHGCSVLDIANQKVPDGLRYHVLDVWVDGVVQCEGYEDQMDVLMAPVKRVATRGATKVLKQRAEAALADDRLNGGESVDDGGDGMEKAEDEDEFEGFD